MTKSSALRSFFSRTLAGIVLLVVLEALARLATRAGEATPPRGPEVAAYGVERLRANDAFLWTPLESWNLEAGNANTLRIAVVGEGTSVNPSIAGDQRWPRVLARLFDRALGIPGVDLRIYASPGFTAAQGEAVLDRVLGAFDPHIVIFQFGNGNEVDPAIEGKRDAEWLARPKQGSLESYSALLRITRPWIDDAVRERGTSPGSVRQDRSEYESSLARMIARVRENGCCAALLEPVYRPPLDGRASLSEVIEIYRLATAKVAGLYGVPLIPIREAMLADASAFRTTSTAWSERGHRVAARQAFHTLCSDSSFLLAMRRWLALAPDDARWNTIAGTFALLHSIHESGPGGHPAASALEPLNLAARSGTDVKTAAALRLALVRWKGVELPAVPAILKEFEVAESDRLGSILFAASAVLNGKADDARARLHDSLDTEPTRENAIAHLLSGISSFSSDPEAARAEFTASIACDPGLGIADLWLAKSHFLSGNTRQARLAFRLGRRTLAAHSGGWTGSAITRADDDESIGTCLRDEPTLFGRDQRDALGRLLFARLVDGEAEAADEFLLLDRYLIARTSNPANVDPNALEALRERAKALADDPLIALSATALLGSDFDLALEFGNAALSKRETPEAHRVCALIEIERRAPAAAIEHLSKIPSWDSDARLVALFARCERERGNTERARELLEQALQRWPNVADLKVQLDLLRTAKSG